MRKYLIKNDVFDANFYLLIGSDKEVTKFLNEIEPPEKDGKLNWIEDEADDDCFGTFYYINKPLKGLNIKRVISLKRFKKGLLFDIGVLAHEIQHYVNNVCIDKGIKHTRGDEETSAYLMEYTLKECLKVLQYK